MIAIELCFLGQMWLAVMHSSKNQGQGSVVPFRVAYVEQPLNRVNQLLRAAPLPDGWALKYHRTHATPYFLLG